MAEDIVELAGCVIPDEQGRILLLHRSQQQGEQWEIPGGKIEANEEADAAASREVREELKLVVRIIKFLGQTSFRQKDKKYNYRWYQAEIVEGRPSLGEPNLHDAWSYLDIRPAIIERLPLSPNVRRLREQLSRGQISLD